MNAKPEAGLDRGSFSPATLGELLYTRQDQARVAEAHWTTLLNRIAARDQQALQTLYLRSYRLVFTLVMRITNDQAAAEEVTVDVFHNLWRSAEQYDAAGGTVIGWIMNQARSRAIDRLRFEQRLKRPPPQGHSAAADGRAADQPQELAARLERARALRYALRVLTADERRVIETTYFEELTYSGAAARLNAPVETVKTRIRSALWKLRAALASLS